MNIDLDFKQVDLYELFEILPDATESEIKKAYRKKALLHHPDKNPDNPKANEIFQQLSKALEVLTDKEARKSYDKLLKAKKEREIKSRKLDSKRRRLKDELDAKEKIAQEIFIQNEAEKLQQEIERIRKEGYVMFFFLLLQLCYYCFLIRSKQLEEANILLQNKLEKQYKKEVSNQSNVESNRVKVKRKTKIDLTEQLLKQEFSKYGKIITLIVSRNRKTAILEYESSQSLTNLRVNCPKNFEVKILGIKQKLNESQLNENPSAKILSSMGNNHEDFEDFVLRQLQEAENKQKD